MFYSYRKLMTNCIKVKKYFTVTTTNHLLCQIYNHRLPSIDDDRLNSLLNDLHNTYTGKEYVAQGDKESINPASLDAYSKKHFPLCMRNTHEVLRSTHHLKHFSRLQYGLFLKGIGERVHSFYSYYKN